MKTMMNEANIDHNTFRKFAFIFLFANSDTARSAGIAGSTMSFFFCALSCSFSSAFVRHGGQAACQSNHLIIDKIIEERTVLKV